jgi:hypothetical protein
MQRTLGDESMGAPTIGRVVVVYELVYAHAHDEIVRAIQRAYAATKMKICVARPQNVPDDCELFLQNLLQIATHTHSQITLISQTTPIHLSTRVHWVVVGVTCTATMDTWTIAM